jgi:hypothetical protein
MKRVRVGKRTTRRRRRVTMFQGRIVQKSPSNVKEITDASRLKNEKSALVFWYSNHCIHCHNFRKVWDRLVAKFPEISFYAIDGNLADHDSIPEGWPQIKYFPTIWAIKDGMLEEYTRRRLFEPMNNYLKTHLLKNN